MCPWCAPPTIRVLTEGGPATALQTITDPLPLLRHSSRLHVIEVEEDALATLKSTRRPVSYNAHTATHTGVSGDCPYRRTARTACWVATRTTHTVVRVLSRYGRYG